MRFAAHQARPVASLSQAKACVSPSTAMPHTLRTEQLEIDPSGDPAANDQRSSWNGTKGSMCIPHNWGGVKRCWKIFCSAAGCGACKSNGKNTTGVGGAGGRGEVIGDRLQGTADSARQRRVHGKNEIPHPHAGGVYGNAPEGVRNDSGAAPPATECTFASTTVPQRRGTVPPARWRGTQRNDELGMMNDEDGKDGTMPPAGDDR